MTMIDSLATVVLAAGLGTRMKSARAKVLHGPSMKWLTGQAQICPMSACVRGGRHRWPQAEVIGGQNPEA
jgi:hypothetical protein